MSELKTIITPEMRALYEAQAALWPVMKRAASPNARWFLGQVVSGSERTSGERLGDFGLGMYYPKFATSQPKPFRRMSKKQREAAQEGFVTMEPKIKALMPGYMFLHFDMENDPWRDVLDFAGVRGLWSNGTSVPRPVPDELIGGFTAAEVEIAVPGKEPMRVIPGKTPIKQLFKVGDEVRIGYGPFASFSGVVEELPPGYGVDTPVEELGESLTFKICVSIFGRGTPVEMVLGQFEHV